MEVPVLPPLRIAIGPRRREPARGGLGAAVLVSAVLLRAAILVSAAILLSAAVLVNAAVLARCGVLTGSLAGVGVATIAAVPACSGTLALGPPVLLAARVLALPRVPVARGRVDAGILAALI